MEIRKRFPATTTLDKKTFLNDNRINAELYAFLQSLTYSVNKETILYKTDLPTQSIICQKSGIKSSKTLRIHLKYLIDQGYIIDKIDRYLFPNLEDFYQLIPLRTLQYLNDNVKENVIKIFIYLGQCYKMKPNYEFTNIELAEHIGIKIQHYSKGYDNINNNLDILRKIGLINYKTIYKNKKQIKVLTYFSFNIAETPSCEY